MKVAIAATSTSGDLSFADGDRPGSLHVLDSVQRSGTVLTVPSDACPSGEHRRNVDRLHR